MIWIAACLLALILLCCSCSAGSGENPLENDPAVPNTGTVEPPGSTEGPNENNLTSGAEVTAGAEVESGDPVVYMTTAITPEGLMAIYEALDWTPGSSVAVKLSTG